LRWSRAGRETGSIRSAVIGNEKPEKVILTYHHRSGPGEEWQDVQQPVSLSWTACNFGGERPWFVCPGAACGRKVAILYGPGRYFLCRHCCDLTYESQRENEMHRALRRAQIIRKRLGGSANMTKPFPEKPKGMHHETYWRLREEHDEAEMTQLEGMREWLDKLEKKVG
jgi:5-methylcytosine-specific restriction endonuclease McrA